MLSSGEHPPGGTRNLTTRCPKERMKHAPLGWIFMIAHSNWKMDKKFSECKQSRWNSYFWDSRGSSSRFIFVLFAICADIVALWKRLLLICKWQHCYLDAPIFLLFKATYFYIASQYLLNPCYPTFLGLFYALSKLKRPSCPSNNLLNSLPSVRDC